MQIYRPDGDIGQAPAALAASPASLSGLRIAVLDNGKPNAAFVMTRLAETLAEHFGLPDLRVVVLPHPIGGTAPDTLTKWADDAVDTVLALCTRRAAA